MICRITILCICLLFGVGVSACSLPNLETPSCTASRDTVREFYSFHFGNDMKFSTENLALRKRFLTPELATALANSPADSDVFTTKSTDFPKAFRIGACEAISPDKTTFSVLFFWKDETRSEQREIKLEASRQNDKWLISKIDN